MWVRVHWTKQGKIRWTSHRDAARIWERAFRRADIAVVYSGGFSPRPRMSFGLALPTGCESAAEFLDVDLLLGSPEFDGLAGDIAALTTRLSSCLPSGMAVVGCAPVPTGQTSLQADVVACEWDIDITGCTISELTAAIDRFLVASEVMVSKRRKDAMVVEDIRPAVESLVPTGVTADGIGVLVRAMVATKPRGVRPGDLVAGLFPGNDRVAERSSLRVTQLIERAGERLPLRAAPHLAAA